MLRAMFDFLSSPPTVTVWTEASWVFGNPPRLASLSQRGEKALRELNPHAMYRLDQMRKDLERLVTHWGHILQDEPNEIWEPSVPAFLQSPFWVGTTEATLSTIGSSDEPSSGSGRDAILIATQTSSNGREVGIIRAWPSL